MTMPPRHTPMPDQPDYRIRTFDDPALKFNCHLVPDDDPLEFLEPMRNICSHYKAVGLAAPQIGVLKRVIFIMPMGRGRQYFCINPVIVEKSKDMIVVNEGCLSYPGVVAPVARHEWIKLGYKTIKRKTDLIHLSGWEARIAQHEVDHLDGICRVGDFWRGGKSAIPNA